jgi:AraC family transcriptional regulator of arabinose operon
MPPLIQNLSKTNFLVRAGRACFGDVLYAPGGVCGPRTQHDFQLILLHSGSLILTLDRTRKLEVRPGEAVLLAPGHRELFRFDPNLPSRHTWCALAPRALPASLRPCCQPSLQPVPYHDHLLDLLEQVIASPLALLPDDPVRTAHFEAMAVAFFTGFLMSPAPSRSGGFPHTALARTERFLQSEFSRPLTAVDIARAAGVSIQYLGKLLRQAGKPTAIEWLYQKRLEHAAELLARTGLTVAEISERCGFANPFHFSRKFRQYHGRSPRAVRQSLWRTPA